MENSVLTGQHLLQSIPALSMEDDRNHSLTLSPATTNHSITQRPLVKITDAEMKARVQWIHYTTPHFELSYDKICLHSVEIETLAHVIESAYQSIFSLTKEGLTERFPVYITDLRSPSLMGRKTSTHFSAGERAIYLVRNSHESLDTELVAMLTHAMRFPRYIKHYGITRGWAILEDSFATFLSERLQGTTKHGYPFYGVEPDVIAHYLKEQAVLPNLYYAWHSLRFASELERRVLAGAFLLYLGDTASDDRVVEFSKYDDEVTSDTFKVFFGKTLEQLEEGWSEHLPKSLLGYTETEYHEMMEHWKKMMGWRAI